MILAQRILDRLRSDGPIARGELANWFRDTDRIDFDSTLTRLMRQNSVSLELGKYDLVAQKPNGRTPFIATATSEAPGAADEVAASLTPAETTAYCLSCNASHPESAFPRSKTGKLYTRCKQSYGAMAAKGRRAAKAKRDSLNSPEGECPAGTTSERCKHGTTYEACKLGCPPWRFVPPAETDNAGGSLPTDYTNRGEVMKTPESAAQGSEAGHLTTPHRDGTGAVPQGTEAQATQPSAAPATNTPEKRGNNRDVSAERCCHVASVPETSGSYSSSDPREDVRTPAGSSIAFPRNDNGRTDDTLKRVASKLAQLRAMRVEIDSEIEDLVQLDALYRKVMRT